MATKVKLVADGVVTADQLTLTTASTGTNTTAPATTAFVQQEVAALVDSSPDALNTLNELAAALGDDANFSTTVTNSIATKLPLAGGTLTGGLTIQDDFSAGVAITLDRTESSLVDNLFYLGVTSSVNASNDRMWLGRATTDLTIADDGKVGIGIADPQQLLHINAASPNILLSGTSFPALKFSGSDNTTDAEIYYGIGASDLQVKNYNNGIISFTTNSNQGIVIDASGNVRLGTTTNASTVEIGDISGANYRLSTGNYSLAFQKYDADASAFVNGLTIVGTGVNDGTPNVKVENKLSVNGNIDANAILKVSSDSSGEIAKFESTGNADFNFIADPPEFNLEDSGGSTQAKRARMTINDGILKFQALTDDDTGVNYHLLSGYLGTGNVGIGYPPTQTYPSDAKFMISNAGANGMEFSGTAISGENRILNYNRSGSAYVPMTIVGSEFNVAISGGTEYFKVLSDGRINLPGNPSGGLGTSSTPVLANVAGYGLQIATSYFGVAPGGAANGLKFEIDNNGNVNMSHTGYLRIPRGTTAQRPSTGAVGMIRYNTTLGAIEEFDGTNWVVLSATFAATGGTVTTSGIYTYHTFTSSGTFSVSAGAKSISYLIVAGGGGGGYNAGAGGGAGGYRTGTTTVDSGTGNYTITIGAGGAGKTSDTGVADNGSNSSAFGVTSTGGGGGISSAGSGSSGGSGGGGAATGTGGSGTAGQGNDGGDGNGNDGASRSGAGGGGASAAGQDTPSDTQGGNGGAGNQWLNSSYYAGGGGGSPHSGNGGSGGTGGGGAGGNGNPSQSDGTAGTANTGGGGGSGGGYGNNGANGGSGIVIIRYS